MNNVWINLTYCSNTRLQGFEELKSELSENYIVQVRKEWLPAYSEYNEIWLDILINSSFADYMLNIIVGGIVWDVTKSTGHFILKKLWNAIASFTKKNNNEQSIERISFQFDDVTIVLNGVSQANEDLVNQLFRKISEHLPILKTKGIDDITQIIIPVEEYEDENGPQYRESSYDYLNENESPEVWKIVSDYGLTHLFYKPDKEEIIANW